MDPFVKEILRSYYFERTKDEKKLFLYQQLKPFIYSVPIGSKCYRYIDPARPMSIAKFSFYRPQE